MPSGRNSQLTKQKGESLIVFELGKRGYLATAFSGNVPRYDIVAISPKGRAFLVQVKAINKGDFQLSAADYLDIEMDGDRQIVKGKLKSNDRNLVCIFVTFNTSSPPAIFIFKWAFLQDHFAEKYVSCTRPRNPKSFHCTINPKALARFQNKWKNLPDYRE